MLCGTSEGGPPLFPAPRVRRPRSQGASPHVAVGRNRVPAVQQHHGLGTPQVQRELRTLPPVPLQEVRPRRVPLKEDKRLGLKKPNAEFDKEHLQDKRNPLWVAKRTVAYLWARTVQCKNCRATIPLLKTRWLCKKSSRRVLLAMAPAADKVLVALNVESNAPKKAGNVHPQRSPAASCAQPRVNTGPRLHQAPRASKRR